MNIHCTASTHTETNTPRLKRNLHSVKPAGYQENYQEPGQSRENSSKKAAHTENVRACKKKKEKKFFVSISLELQSRSSQLEEDEEDGGGRGRGVHSKHMLPSLSAPSPVRSTHRSSCSLVHLARFWFCWTRKWRCCCRSSLSPSS